MGFCCCQNAVRVSRYEMQPTIRSCTRSPVRILPFIRSVLEQIAKLHIEYALSQMQSDIWKGLQKKTNKPWNTHPHLVEVSLSILYHCIALPEVPWLIFHFCPSSGHAFWIPSDENDSNAWYEPLNKNKQICVTNCWNKHKWKALTVAGWMMRASDLMREWARDRDHNLASSPH